MVSTRVIPTEFESCEEIVHGNLVMPSGEGPFPGICKFHGLPGSDDQAGGIASRLAAAGYAVLTFDFRGFRGSDGTFSLSGEIEDARNAITHLLEFGSVIDGWVGVYGASFGGTVAICEAARDSRVSAVCVRAPVYDTLTFVMSGRIREIMEYILEEVPCPMHGIDRPPLRRRIEKQLVEDAREFNPMNDISRIAPRPLFIITGDADTLIDVSGVRRLYDAAGEPKEMAVVAGADHNLSSTNAYELTARHVVSWFRETSSRTR